MEAVPELVPSAVLPGGETRSLAAVFFFFFFTLTIVILMAMYMQRAWPGCAFLMEPLAEPEAPARWW